MSRKNALNELSRRFPSPPEFQQISEGLTNFPDMVVVIMGASILEAMVERLLSRAFVNRTAELESRLFKNNGPLSDFRSKLLLAEAMNIIEPKLLEIMDSIRLIRNAFAHSKTEINFSTKEIQQEISRSILPWAKLATELMTDDEPPEKKEWLVSALTFKFSFVLAVKLCAFLLDDKHEKTTGERLLRAKKAEVDTKLS